MCPLESQRHPIPSGHFRISSGPEQEAGEKQKLEAEFPAQYLAQTRAPPPAGPAVDHPGTICRVDCSGTTRRRAAHGTPVKDTLPLGAGLGVEHD